MEKAAAAAVAGGGAGTQPYAPLTTATSGDPIATPPTILTSPTQGEMAPLTQEQIAQISHIAQMTTEELIAAKTATKAKVKEFKAKWQQEHKGTDLPEGTDLSEPKVGDMPPEEAKTYTDYKLISLELKSRQPS